MTCLIVSQVDKTTLVDLAAAENGGTAIGCSNKHFGEPRFMIRPGRGINMGDGWETSRKNGRPSVLKMGADGTGIHFRLKFQIFD